MLMVHCRGRGDRLVSGLERRFEPRRLEVINGAGGRRVWSADAKAAVLDETLVPARRRVGGGPPPRADAATGVRLAPGGATRPRGCASVHIIDGVRARGHCGADARSRLLRLRNGPDVRDGVLRQPRSNWRSPASRSASALDASEAQIAAVIRALKASA